jgi:hypothetical protein
VGTKFRSLITHSIRVKIIACFLFPKDYSASTDELTAYDEQLTGNKLENNRTSTSAETFFSTGILLFEKKKGAENFDA